MLVAVDEGRGMSREREVKGVGENGMALADKEAVNCLDFLMSFPNTRHRAKRIFCI